MCGFIGFINSNQENQEGVMDRMLDTIKHRGPDSGEKYCSEKISLGFRRLRIIDLSEEGNQPMQNEDKSCVLVFNGEIYNYQELREELLDRGHHFKSNTDSEVVIHAYEEYGVELLRRLRGMFSFAIWDHKNESLFLARDMFGVKPLYYSQHTSDESFIFGSEIKSFLPYPGFKKEFNQEALKPYLTFQYSVFEETFFKGVHKLKPAHYLIYKQGSIEIKPYSIIDFNENNLSEQQCMDRINEQLNDSVQHHKNSDVNVGSFLSGGVDSSYITALLEPNKTFSIGFQDYDGIFNETNIANDLSKRLGIENHQKLLDAETFFDSLPTIQYHMDEPLADLSAVPLYFVSKLASEHVTVVLSGEGADELFGGYAWYQKSLKSNIYEKLPSTIRRAIARFSKLLPQNKVTTFLIKGGQNIEEKFIGQAKIFEEEEALHVLQVEYRSSPTIQSITSEVYADVQDKDDLTKMQYLDLKLWLPGDILLKADKMSMAHSIEVRVPFLDKEVMTLATKIPSKFRDNKYALRKAANQVLPKEWSTRKKVGFPVPFRQWIREEKYYNLIREMFQSDIAEKFFHPQVLMDLLNDHFSEKKNNTRKIWTVYTFLIWYKRFFIYEAENSVDNQLESIGLAKKA
ncbi:asparagine synthase (glutamine-hydrolyzing) [Ornithinibacillus sp. L9]|uniref:asparagine synthase (glutamine-hydrolyzing) n=1 Tax=Ornithinibacillus caprae TaxID=2678566 RepID=A0A6N8FGQ8_9BACI|nr:asparagine synthase (glutamine-hydrolyzing) [Ornithinibacillus caprae]MUK88653.1 asparagine synthase (glutamine-hydrolyzing) [Ornithinibacillus caprae]